VKFDIDGNRTLTICATEIGTTNSRRAVIDNEWISKINFQKEAEIKKKCVILEQNII